MYQLWHPARNFAYGDSFCEDVTKLSTGRTKSDRKQHLHCCWYDEKVSNVLFINVYKFVFEACPNTFIAVITNDNKFAVYLSSSGITSLTLFEEEDLSFINLNSWNSVMQASNFVCVSIDSLVRIIYI